VEQRRVDVAIVGAGTAGLGAHHAARRHTDTVVLIEGGPHGTTCARVGCMPSKLLIAAAEAAHAVGDAPVFGVHPGGPVRVDGRAVMARVRAERDRFVGLVLDAVTELPAETRLDGWARFVDPHRLQVGDHTLVQAERIVLATGSRPAMLPQFEALGPLAVTSDDVFDWTELPDSVAVFGGGVVGLELGQALHRLGVRVRLFGVGGDVGPISDGEVRACAERCFADELAFDPRADVKSVAERDGAVEVTFRDRDGAERSERFTRLLAATGRRPRLDRLALEHSGLALDDRGIPLFDRTTGQCGDSHVFLAGDANADVPLLHEAADEGRIAGDNAGRFPDLRCHPRRTPLSIVFTEPQIAIVGRSHRELVANDVAFAVGAVDFADQGRSRVLHRNRGLLHIYGERGSGLLLGAEMVGPRAEHLAHLLAWSVQQRLPVDTVLDMPFYHPVIEEGLRTALRDLRSQLKLGPEPVPHCLDCGPGA
jgi:dihydrolipoamide dehydrogenase